MVDPSHEFVARRLWLLVAVVTLPLTALAAVLGGVLSLPGAVVALLVTGIPIVGWLLLTPLLLLFGEAVADALVGPPGDVVPVETAAESADDPIESLKRRYAEGEIGDAEFERRLERLLAPDETGRAAEDAPSPRSGPNGANPAGDRSAERARDDDDLFERE